MARSADLWASGIHLALHDDARPAVLLLRYERRRHPLHEVRRPQAIPVSCVSVPGPDTARGGHVACSMQVASRKQTNTDGCNARGITGMRSGRQICQNLSS